VFCSFDLHSDENLGYVKNKLLQFVMKPAKPLRSPTFNLYRHQFITIAFEVLNLARTKPTIAGVGAIEMKS
jgi:hypothetical protein